MTETCCICKLPIKLNEVVIRYAYGEFIKDDFGGIGFDEPKSQNTLGYAHINCLDNLRREIERLKKYIELSDNIKNWNIVNKDNWELRKKVIGVGG